MGSIVRVVSASRAASVASTRLGRRYVTSPPSSMLFSGLDAAGFDRNCVLVSEAHDKLARDHPQFTSTAYAQEQATYLLFHKLRPLVESSQSSSARLIRLSGEAVRSLGLDLQPLSIVIGKLGNAPVVAVDVTSTADPQQVIESLRTRGFLLASHAATGPAPTGSGVSHSFMEGRELIIGPSARGGAAAWDGTPIAWGSPGYVQGDGTVTGLDAALFGLARSLLVWSGKSKFCGACGSPNIPVHGGVQKKCAACGEVQYPRTDPVVISLVQSPDGGHCLLSRQPGFPPGVYSCCAGYLEGGESVEEAVARELLEETGVPVSDITYVASQPWPLARGAFSQVMLGCVATAPASDISAPVVFDTHELQDAKWFSRQQVQAAVSWHYRDAPFMPAFDSAGGAGADAAAVKLRVPGPYAIAHQLMRHWLQGGSVGELSAAGARL